MKRKIHITRKDTSLTKYSGKALNIWFDSDTPNPPNYKLASGKTITVMSVNEKEHYLVFQRPGFLGGDVKRYTVPKGSDDLELTVSVDAYGKVSIRKKPAKKSSGGSKSGGSSKSSGGKSSGGSKVVGGSKAGGAAKKPVSTTRNLYVTRIAGEGHLPGIPIRMAVDYMSKQPVIYEFNPNMEYTIITDKKKHDLVFFYPDVQTGDLVLRSLEAGSDDAAFLVGFDVQGRLVAEKTDPPKKTVGADVDGGSIGKSGIADSPTTAGVKEFIAFHIDPAKGSPVPVLLHALKTCEYLRVSVGSNAVNFLMHYEDDKEDHEVVSFSYETANKNLAGAAGTFTSLNTLGQRNQLLAAIRDFVNSECPGVSMQGTKIYLDASSASGGSGVKSGGQKTTTPDLENSLTYIALNFEFMNFFDQDSPFASDLDKIAKTCYLSVEEDRVRVTIMAEDFETAQTLPDGGTQVVEFVYRKVETARQIEVLNITQAELDNQFDRLSREEDRQILMEKLLNVIKPMSHLIVEGNSFRSRRRGEELIDVAHCLTTAALKHKIIKMFTPDSTFVDVLRYSNVDFCCVMAYSRCISFIYIDKDFETCEKFTYDFDELVGEELLEGEECFGELKYEPEQEQLSRLLTQALDALPYLKVESDAWIRVNTDMLSMKSEVYVKKTEPEPPDEPDVPAKSTLADSPTTAALLAQLTEYFKEGSMFDQMLKSGMYERISLNTGARDAALGFWKKAEDGSQNLSGTMSLDYAYFGPGQEGSFTELDMDQQDELEEILWNAFPFLRN